MNALMILSPALLGFNLAFLFYYKQSFKEQLKKGLMITGALLVPPLFIALMGLV